MQGLNHKIKRFPLPVIAIIILALAAAILVGYSTTWDPWTGSDSAAYLVSAQNIARGEGLGITLPSGQVAYIMAPVYPLVLAGFGFLKVPLIDAARWLDIFLFGLTILGCGTTFYRLSHSRWLAVPFSALLLVFPVMFKIFTTVMTEPLFIFTMMAALFLLAASLVNPNRSWLIAAAVTAGIATLVRFIGVALLPVGIAALLLLQATAWKRRSIDAILFSVLFALPVLAYVVWVSSKPVSSPVGLVDWRNLWETLQPVRAGLVDVLWEWVPFQADLPVTRYLGRLLALVLCLAGLFSLPALASLRLYGRKLQLWIADRDVKLFGVMALFITGYLFAFVFIYIFRSPAQDVNERTLLPLYPPLLGMLFAALSLLQRAYTTNPRRRLAYIAMRSLPWLVLAVGLAAYAPQTTALAGEYHKKGAGYSSAVWQASQTIQAIKLLPEDVAIISNEAGAILLHTGRFALEISELYSALQTPLEAPNLRYGDDLTDPSQQFFRNGGAALVLFQPSFYWQLYEIYPGETEQRMEALLQGLTLYGEYPDGSIYFYPTDK
jgi:4-amino-4-deoxy-L-arabinose transferase-like glycosyltransferase